MPCCWLFRGDDLLYFAYGSNMHWPQIVARCPAVRFVSRAVLRDHKLAFTRKSVSRGCGVADAVAHDGALVWGVVYELADQDLVQLDQSEGFRVGRDRNSYERRECTVFLENEDNAATRVEAYFGVPETNPPLPNSAYRQLLVGGATHWRLPAAYLSALHAIRVSG